MKTANWHQFEPYFQGVNACHCAKMMYILSDENHKNRRHGREGKFF